MSSARLYFGSVSHRRLRPRRHVLRYRLFWTLLDIDRLAESAGRSVLFSHNRFNLLSFHDSDHGDGSGRPLRPQVERLLVENGVDFDGGAIRLFCMPRVLGYGFNRSAKTSGGPPADQHFISGATSSALKSERAGSGIAPDQG